MSSLVLYNRRYINLGLLHKYKVLWAVVLSEREKFSRILKSTITVCNLYKDADLLIITKRLRLDIRLLSKGTTTDYALDSVSSDLYYEANTEQLFNAQSVLLKSAYRRLAMLVHPDRGGDVETFNAIYAAYRNRDLTFLHEFYLQLMHKHNLFWMQEEGIAYALQEIQRPAVSLQIFKNNPLYAVNRLHTIGQKEKAIKAMHKYQESLNFVLNSELNYLHSK